jgi:nucleoside-diphosphate-sugar epimerase
MIRQFIENKKFFITGGTGTLGSALVRRILDNGGQVAIYSRDEAKQAYLHSERPEITRFLGDIRDREKISLSMLRYKPHVVIHTAALKRIDDMEFNPDECIKTNIGGTENVAISALNSGVEKCILVSTDKACLPVNVYGSSKFIAERVFTNYDYNSDKTIFSSVRYGNVICSRGSFIPLWLKLLSDNKNIKVTSMDMTRFLFTIQDAVDTVLNAVSYSQGGEVFIPKINSFGMNAILKALESITTTSINYEIMGLRPGEKLHEDMLAETEKCFTFEVPGVNLLCVRPQYTNKKHNLDWKPYEGLPFNSSLHTNDDVEKLVHLIERGQKETE